VNRARSFIYSTALPPVIIAAALEDLRFLKDNPLLGKDLLRNAERFRQRLKAAGFNTGSSASQIIPLIIGENIKTLKFAERLREEGILAVAIRPPTVPEGTARIRLSVSLAHSRDDLDNAAGQIIATARKEGLL
jgi:7-keto-8-aminopelargonate synthetase-like enzyme